MLQDWQTQHSPEANHKCSRLRRVEAFDTNGNLVDRDLAGNWCRGYGGIDRSHRDVFAEARVTGALTAGSLSIRQRGDTVGGETSWGL